MSESSPKPRAPRSAVVVGAGIVGAALAHALQQRGIAVHVVAGAAARASDVPVAIAQPVMGRHASASPLRVGAWRHACRLIEEVAPDAVLSRGLLRFTTDEKTASRWRDRCAALPVTVASWCAPARCRELIPGLSPQARGGIWVPDALALDLAQVVSRLLDGVPRTHENVRAISAAANGPSAELESGETLTADVIIIAAGVATAAMVRHLNPTLELPWRGTLAGEVVRATAAQPAAMVGEKGQIVPLKGGVVALTASQRPDGQAEHVDDEGVAALMSRYTETLPQNAPPVLVDAWAGKRATTLDAHPVVGPLDADGQICVCSGMGSRGVIFGTFAAGTLVDELCGETGAIPAEWAPLRRATRHPGRPTMS